MRSFWKRSRITICLLWICRVTSSPDEAAELLARHVVSKVPEGDIEAALREFNAFSQQNYLGMHLGEDKDALIKTSVQQGLPKTGPGVVFETGCHAGDGTLVVAEVLAARQGSTIVSTEAHPAWLAAAKSVVGHATSKVPINYVPLQLIGDTSFETFLDTMREQHNITQFHSVILDQDGADFRKQLAVMLKKGFIQHGGTVFVDNVKRKAGLLQDYINFVNPSSGNGFETRVHDVQQPYPDAVAISTFNGDGSVKYKSLRKGRGQTFIESRGTLLHEG